MIWSADDSERNNFWKQDKTPLNPIRELARALAHPQPPSALAWRFLIGQRVLKDGMSLQDACTLLGWPSYRKDGEVRWYFNFRGNHVFPDPRATEEDGTLKDWKVYMG